MASPPPRLAKAPTLPPTAAAAACLLRPCARRRLVRASHGATGATPLLAAAASPDLACSHHPSVAASPSPRAATSTSPRRPAGGPVVLAVGASAVAVSACLVFFSAVRSLLICKREAEFLGKYFDSTAAKLPETMASVRLVAREVSDLAADLTDLSQELTKGIKGSMSVIHTAEAQLDQLTSAPPGNTQRMANGKKVAGEPLLASTVRDLRELVQDIRSGFAAAIGFIGVFIWASSFGSKRRKDSS
ncbi:hypothetical protein ACP4OV_017479 [Aristida adscensionis]